MELTILVPRPDSPIAGHLPRGTAIVSDPRRSDPERILCYYEESRIAVNLRAFADRLVSAAGRLAARYPTHRIAAWPRDELVEVGRYDAVRFAMISLDNAGVLEAWAEESAEEIAGRRVAAGALDWTAAAALVQPPDGRPVGGRASCGRVLWYKSRAGQLLRFDVARHRADAFEHDDPRLDHALRPILSDAEARRALGR